MKPISERLAAARDLLMRGWCKGSTSRTAGGADCEITSVTAAAFCARGACVRVELGRMIELGLTLPARTSAFTEGLVPTDLEPALEKALEQMQLEPEYEYINELSGENDPIVDFNDNHDTGKKDVLELFQRAIAIARREEGWAT